jgi:predicted ATPase
MFVSRLIVKNWKNFKAADVLLGERMFLVGPNAGGKSNFLDIFRFMKDIVNQTGGGLQKAAAERGGLQNIRCLSAEVPGIELEFYFNESSAETHDWKYVIGLKQEGKGRHRTMISKEEVWKGNRKILDRPGADDKKDNERLTQTHLEQINSNQDFRDIYKYFNAARYFHIIPQLVRYPEKFGNTSAPGDEDSFGFQFTDSVFKWSSKTTAARMDKLEAALERAVPQLKNLRVIQDEKGTHFEIYNEHWKPGTRLLEDQLSDGTLRLMGLLWSVLENHSLLLLEEPENSLHSSVIKKIPSLIYRLTRNKKRQLIISTHSPDLLADPGIGGEEILLLRPGKEGTDIKVASSLPEIKNLLESGFSTSEAVIPYTNPEKVEQLGLFE